MTLALEAPRPLLALETKATADARRISAAFAGVTAGIQAFGSAVARMGRTLAQVAAQVAAQIAHAFAQLIRPGYYWRDGKLRRDHSYFRQRARDRRAAKRLAKA